MNEISETDIFEAPYSYNGEYLYSYGEISKFFKEVKENKRLFGTRCSKCGKVWMPPRKYCSDCYSPAEWVLLSGRGKVLSCTYCFYAASTEMKLAAMVDLPYVLAVIKLDEADTGILHTVVAKDRRPGTIKSGTRVKIAWQEQREGKVSDYYFVPEQED